MKHMKQSKTVSNVKWIIRLLTIIILLICIFSINSIISYFTDIETNISVFSIDAKYTVTFDYNFYNQEVSQYSSEIQKISYNISTNLNASSFQTIVGSSEELGYEFIGWNTQQDGSGISYLNGQSVNNLGDITLYAQWTPIVYTIEYKLNGGIVELSNPTTYTVETETFTLNNPIQEGFTFTGWAGTDIVSGYSGSSVKAPDPEPAKQMIVIIEK